MGRVGHVALGPLYDFAMRREGKVGPRTGWALGGWIRISPYRGLRPTRFRGEAVDVRIYSDACTDSAGIAAAALFQNDDVVELRGTANEVLSEGLQVTNDNFGLELFSMVTAV